MLQTDAIMLVDEKDNNITGDLPDVSHEEIYRRQIEKAEKSKRFKVNLIISHIILFVIVFVFQDLIQYITWTIFRNPAFDSSIYRILQLIPILSLVVVFLLSYLETGSFFPLSSRNLTPSRERLTTENDSHRRDLTGDWPQVRPDNLADTPTIGTPSDILRLSTNRINEEIKNLGWRGNVNLTIGIVTTILGAIILIYTVYTTQFSDEFTWKSVAQTMLRLSIALFLQTFAYFFLKLYKSNLEDVKYYQNEITNIEGKFMGLLAAQSATPPISLKTSVETLIKTERNFLLRKGDSTIGLERERLEKNEMIELVRDALGAVGKRRLFRVKEP
jgi:hypothetical protein